MFKFLIQREVFTYTSPYFFSRHTVDVARDLLGKILVWKSLQGIILETEAYRGSDDPASHAFKNTPRAQVMYGMPGKSYVYMIYGMHYCFNISTEENGCPGGVLIRRIALLNPTTDLIIGPGRVCKKLGITRKDNNTDLTNITNCYLQSGVKVTNFDITPRIGIKKGREKLWRFMSNSMPDN